MQSNPLADSFMASNRRALNFVVGLAGQFFSVVMAGAIAFTSNHPLWNLLLWVVGTSAIYLRLSFPRLMTSLVVCTLFFSLFNDEPLLALWWTAPVVVYHWAKHGTARVRQLIFVAALLASTLGGLMMLKTIGSSANWQPWESMLFWLVATFICAALCSLSWFVGNTSRLSLLRSQQLFERAQQLELEREQERKLAAQDERARIAREMHDIVAHSLSSVISQADGALYVTRSAANPSQKIEVASSTFETISQASRSALDQMRQLLGVLRTDQQAQFRPLPSLSDIDELIHNMEAHGFRVSYVPLTSFTADLLPAGADLAAYRVVQEALTNISKHAASSPHVLVELKAEKHALRIRVENKASEESESSVPGSKAGLVGMAERVELYGGTLKYGRLHSGGFRVVATFPLKHTQEVRT